MKRKALLIALMLCFACFGAANAQQALPYSYGFEDNNLATDGWTAQITSTSSGINTAAAHTGSYGFRFQYSENPGYLVSPLLTGGTNGIDLSFYYKEYSSSYGNENFQVGYTTNANETDPSNFTYGEIIEASTSWQLHTETLPAGTVRMAIKYLYVDAFYLYLDDFSFEASSPCAKPENLEVNLNEVGTTLQAVVTWSGTATNDFIVTVNGTPTAGQTSPYTFNVNLDTNYEVVVEADCGAVGTSNPVTTSFTTPACLPSEATIINYTLNDSYGDGWSNNYILIVEGCMDDGEIVDYLTIESGNTLSGSLQLCGDIYQFVWYKGDYPTETSWVFTDASGNTLFSGAGTSSMATGDVLYSIGVPVPSELNVRNPGTTSATLGWTENGTARAWQICVNGDEENLINARENPYTLERLTPDTEYTVKVRATGDATSCWSEEYTFTTAEACAKPTGLAEANIGTNSADLSWNGEARSYVLAYRPWYQVGEDQIATGVLTSYTFDLSEYSGTGSIAIRHYDVSDMFMLNVDDIVVTNAAGTTIFSEDFENGTIPSNITNMDLDGDGYVWGMREVADDDLGNPSGNGYYCVSSASWVQGVGAIHPDNWMIISGIELGGQITFIARGQDPEWAAENFAVYVSAEADMVEETVDATSYQAQNLEPNTPYAWQVKSDCGEYQSNLASSFFKTKDDMLVFATAGAWNVVANWEDAEGNTATALPTVENNVRIDAAAEIPTGVLAEANKVTINGGSITIKDGGQLKQSSATVKVTMEKEIAGYGETEGNYYFIASPFGGRTLYDETSDWNHVEDMFTGSYDLYAFDPTATDGLEWINYKANATHSSFQSDNGNAGLMGGEGYLYANQEGTTLSFVGSTGKSNNYSETKDYTYDGTSSDEWNGWALVGNFFSCNGYISYIDADGNVLDADFYTLNTDNTYTLMSSSEGLAPCTGALINYSATGKVQYATEAPAKRGGVLNMTVTQNRGMVDQARVRFGNGANLGKMSFRNSSKLYMTQGNKDYAVVYSEAQGEMPVSFKAENNGTYTLSFSNENVEFSYLHLIDNMTGNDVDLLENPSYSFEAKTTDYASRFRLVFSTGTASDDNFAFYTNGSIVINNEGNATLKVYDVTGRMINSQSINGSCQVNLNAPAGVYMIQLVNGNNTKTQKIVVK